MSLLPSSPSSLFGARFLLMFITASVLAHVAPAVLAQDHGGPMPDTIVRLTQEQEGELKKATRKILCYCGCPPTLVDECICGTARAIKNDMSRKLLAGISPVELVAEYVAANGERYLAAPPKEGFNLVIWFFPAVAFAVLSALFWYLLKRLTRRDERKPQTVEGPSAELLEYEREIEREMNRRANR